MRIAIAEDDRTLAYASSFVSPEANRVNDHSGRQSSTSLTPELFARRLLLCCTLTSVMGCMGIQHSCLDISGQRHSTKRDSLIIV